MYMKGQQRLNQDEGIAYDSLILLQNKFYTSSYNYIHKHHSRLVPEGVSEASQLFLRDAHVLPKWLS
jgi:hypothetical protein